MRILSLLAVALAGCYDPAINDCQFTCPDNLCPGALLCVAGSCRVPGVTTSCSDAGAGACPAPPAGCTLVTDDSAGCLAACGSPRAWAAAQTACAATGTWNLATLDTPGSLAAAERALNTSISWIGLTRSFVVDPWTWPAGSGSISSASPEWTSEPAHTGTTSLCAALDNGKLYSDDCATLHAFACTSD